MKLYTIVVHYLQMCMKKYGRCPKFGGGDNSTCTFTKRRRWSEGKENYDSYKGKLMHQKRMI
jgi:hypothetical protein